MNGLLNGPFFFTGLCLIVYLLACRLQRITRKTWLNPLLVSILILIGILSVLRIPYTHFKEGSSVIAMMLTPATCVLAIPMYNQRKILKQNLAAILIGTFLGALSSILSVTLLCRIFGLNELITRSLLPKSVTTPIAVSVCEVSGGLPAITVAAVILTGILGSIVIPLLFTKLKIKNSVALGITLGTASHAMGTSKAIEIGEQEGGLSGLAIGITGIFTVILSLLL
ncbi:LrgB family protein [Holdemania filiformis]|uniref:LrgB family protein n=1 Tax=Holdemania filiformis TaxID=61171 RepID=UPI00267077CC|nr:LrgB family protein [Holdemania filiformis]